MNDRKKIGAVLFAGLVVLSAMVVLATPTIAQEYDPWATNLTLDDPSLWLYIEGSTFNPGTSGDTWTAVSWINPVAFTHDTTYTDYVDVIAHNKQNYAVNPYFFVWFKDDTLIEEIIVGHAQTFISDVEYSCNPYGCSPETTFHPDNFVDSRTQTGTTLSPNPGKHQGQTGYWVRVRIGDVPAVSDFSFGNPDDGNFDPAELDSYVRVPVTYTIT